MQAIKIHDITTVVAALDDVSAVHSCTSCCTTVLLCPTVVI